MYYFYLRGKKIPKKFRDFFKDSWVENLGLTSKVCHPSFQSYFLCAFLHKTFFFGSLLTFGECLRDFLLRTRHSRHYKLVN